MAPEKGTEVNTGAVADGKAHTDAREQSSRERESRAQDLENNIEQESAIEQTQGSRARVRVPSPVRTWYTNETRLESTPLQPNQNRMAMGSTWAIDALHLGKGRIKFIRRPVAPRPTHVPSLPQAES